MPTELEHANLTVADPAATAAWMDRIFGWKIRWSGPVLNGAGVSFHVGSPNTYLALYGPKDPRKGTEDSFGTIGGLNHLPVTVDDIARTEARVIAEGFTPQNHADYEPGQRFYFDDHDGIEYEVVSYATT